MTDPAAPPAETRAILPAEQYNTLVRLAQAVELIKLQAQQQLGQALAKRDAYYATIAAAHGLPPTWAALTWQDETLEIAVTAAREKPQ